MPKKEITKQSKIITIIAILIPILFIGAIIFNYSYSINPDKVVLDKVEISNIVINTHDGITEYSANVLATQDININYILIEIDGEELIGYVGKELSNGHTTKINATIDKELSNISNIVYTIK